MLIILAVVVRFYFTLGDYFSKKESAIRGFQDHEGIQSQLCHSCYQCFLSTTKVLVVLAVWILFEDSGSFAGQSEIMKEVL